MEAMTLLGATCDEKVSCDEPRILALRRADRPPGDRGTLRCVGFLAGQAGARGVSGSSKRFFVPALFLLWAAFTAWCVWGFPPPVDLAAHGAQMETLANLIRGDPSVRNFYEIHVPSGYGLVFWLFLPIAFAWNGAVAARLALWVALQLFPLSQLALLRTFRRPDWLLLLGLPFAFNFSYWYGLLSGVFALPLAFLTLAAFARALNSSSVKWIVLANVGAAATLQSHLVAFVALVVALAGMAVSHPPAARSARLAAISLAFPLAISLPKIGSMAMRAVTPGPWPPTEYALWSHINWFFRNYRPEGRLAAWGPFLISVVFLFLWIRRCRKEPLAPAAMFASLALLYAVTPKTLSGIFLISVRLPVFAGLISLLLVEGEAIRRPLRIGLIALSMASLVETAIFHWRFARAVDGLDQMLEGPSPGRHGYWSLAGKEALGSRLIYLEHLGQWLTATRGGVGHNFFADAEHHPVRFRPGVEIPTDLSAASADQLHGFDQILLFGKGPIPPSLRGWRETSRANSWRKLSPGPW